MPSKVLYVGDPHIRPDGLDEGWKLVDLIAKVAEEQGVHHVVFLGDQFHTHSVVHLSVLGFWQKAFATVAQYAKVWALVGNHDMSGRIGDYNHALMLYDPDVVHVVSEPTDAPWGALMIPYVSDHESFDNVVNDNFNPKQKLLICHQTFDGSQYENGFFAKDGIDPNLVPQEIVISGHIHTPQQLGKVWYPGSPRWQTISDANTQRAIWVVEHADDGTILSKTPFDVSGACRPIYALVDREDEPLADLPDFAAATVLIDVYGSHEYVRDRAEELQKLGARVRQFPTIKRTLKVRESEGLAVSFRKFAAAHEPKNGTSKERILELAEQRISWMRGEV